MKKLKYTKAQTAFALKKAKTGIPVEELCRKLGITSASFYNWRKKYGDLDITELKRLKQLEEENSKLKKIVADLSLNKQTLHDVKEKALKTSQKRKLMVDLQSDYKISHRRAASMVLAARSTLVYIPVEKQDECIRCGIIENAHARVRYGFWQIHMLLRREGWKINHK